MSVVGVEPLFVSLELARDVGWLDVFDECFFVEVVTVDLAEFL